MVQKVLVLTITIKLVVIWLVSNQKRQLRDLSEKRFIPLEDIEENYIDFTNNTSLIGDLNIYGQSIEIKGLRPHQWDKFKRMIPPKQLKQLCS